MKILIIEDNEQIVDVLKRYLNKEEYETAVIHDGKEALPYFEKHSVDFVLLCCPMSTALRSASRFAKNRRFQSL
jgi:DNA-binding response OmpR family regulator